MNRLLSLLKEWNIGTGDPELAHAISRADPRETGKKERTNTPFDNLWTIVRRPDFGKRIASHKGSYHSMTLTSFNGMALHITFSTTKKHPEGVWEMSMYYANDPNKVVWKRDLGPNSRAVEIELVNRIKEWPVPQTRQNSDEDE